MADVEREAVSDPAVLAASMAMGSCSAGPGERHLEGPSGLKSAIFAGSRGICLSPSRERGHVESVDELAG